MHIFNKKEFIELNKHKCTELHYLDFGGISIVLGEKSGELYSPFSAPFGGFSSLQKKPSLERVEKAAEGLYEWLKSRNKKCHITLPPFIYGKTLISQSFFCLQNRGFSVEYTDLNYSVDLSKSLHPHPEFCRKLREALKEPLNFKKCENIAEYKTICEIIDRNRKQRGYPPHLSFEEFLEIGKICEVDYFLLSLNEIPVAGAIVYLSSPGIAQLISWGDKREYLRMRPMNLLSMRLIEHYKDRDFSYFDVGISSKTGIPNFGLSHFKSEIGCEITLKHTLVL